MLSNVNTMWHLSTKVYVIFKQPSTALVEGHGREPASHHIPTRQELTPERHVKLLCEPPPSLEELCAQSSRRPKSLKDGSPFTGCDVNVINKMKRKKKKYKRDLALHSAVITFGRTFIYLITEFWLDCLLLKCLSITRLSSVHIVDYWPLAHHL